MKASWGGECWKLQEGQKTEMKSGKGKPFTSIDVFNEGGILEGGGRKYLQNGFMTENFPLGCFCNFCF